MKSSLPGIPKHTQKIPAVAAVEISTHNFYPHDLILGVYNQTIAIA